MTSHAELPFKEAKRWHENHARYGQNRVERWQESGLTAREFSAELGINHRTLTFWKYKLKQQARGSTNSAAPSKPRKPRPEFVQAQAPARAASWIEVALHDLVVRVPEQIANDRLREIIVAVRES
ncbi:MAG: hypothetical protein AAFP04_15230 [Myxococcota bacterium]